MSEGQRIPRQAALTTVRWLRNALAPACCREPLFAGSWRRECREIGDLEMVCLPREVAADRQGQGHLFSDVEAVNVVWIVLDDLRRKGSVIPIAASGSGPDPWWALKRPARAARMLKLDVPGLRRPDGSPMRVEVYMPACSGAWGLVATIRTGPLGFSRGLVTYARSIGKPAKGGRLRRYRPLAPSEDVPPHLPAIDCPRERDVFRELGLQWVEPRNRRGPEDLRPLAP